MNENDFQAAGAIQQLLVIYFSVVCFCVCVCVYFSGFRYLVVVVVVGLLR